MFTEVTGSLKYGTMVPSLKYVCLKDFLKTFEL